MHADKPLKKGKKGKSKSGTISNYNIDDDDADLFTDIPLRPVKSDQVTPPRPETVNVSKTEVYDAEIPTKENPSHSKTNRTSQSEEEKSLYIETGQSIQSEKWKAPHIETGRTIQNEKEKPLFIETGETSQYGKEKPLYFETGRTIQNEKEKLLYIETGQTIQNGMEKPLYIEMGQTIQNGKEKPFYIEMDQTLQNENEKLFYIETDRTLQYEREKTPYMDNGRTIQNDYERPVYMETGRTSHNNNERPSHIQTGRLSQSEIEPGLKNQSNPPYIETGRASQNMMEKPLYAQTGQAIEYDKEEPQIPAHVETTKANKFKKHKSLSPCKSRIDDEALARLYLPLFSFDSYPWRIAEKLGRKKIINEDGNHEFVTDLRLLGELAYQLEYRIVQYVFRPFEYPACIFGTSDIDTSIYHATVTDKGRMDPDELLRRKVVLHMRWQYLQTSFRPFGYRHKINACFARYIINRYGKFNCKYRIRIPFLGKEVEEPLISFIRNVVDCQQIELMISIVKSLVLLSDDEENPVFMPIPD